MKPAYKDKWAFIVGGSTGIGLALAEALVEKDANVLIIARNENRLKAACNELQLKAKPGVECRYAAADATVHEALATEMVKLFEAGIHPYFLFNCAGRALPDYFENITNQQLEETFRLNVLTAWNSVKVCLPAMKQEGGFIINTSSVAGQIGVFGYTDYCIAKFGIIGFSEALKSEVEKYGIKVSVLCPPDTDTPGYAQENRNKPEETKAISGNVTLMSAKAVAVSCLKGLERGNFLILNNKESKLAFLLKSWFPSLLYRIMQADVRKVQRNSKPSNN